jgi:hypothetical protein
MPYTSTSAIEIDKKLRDDFRRRLKDFGVSAETTDPVLAVLFRTFAQQLETLYSETGRIRLALLDELIAGLGIERRMARPAQTVVRFLTNSGTQLVEAGTELIGEAQGGGRLTFTTDRTVMASGAQIALAVTYQDGALQLLPGLEMPEAFQARRPSLDPVRVNLGPNPAIYLAVENLPPSHLSHHSFLLELGPDAHRIQRALESETWCLMGGDGELGSQGILRPKRGNAGTLRLDWLVPEPGDTTPDDKGPIAPELEVPVLPGGFYGSRVFVLPSVPAKRRFLCPMPRGMEAAFGRIFGRDAAPLFSQPRAWLRISLPKDVPSLHNGISSISMHATTASNVECFNQTVYFEKQGTSIPISREAGTASYLVAPLSIFGEAGSVYLPEFQPSSDPGVGRYATRNGRVEMRPAKRPDESPESYANVRIWITAGSRGNEVGPGQVQSFLKKGDLSGIRVTNPTAAAGGTNGESYEDARSRFAEALLSRDRIVTRADAEAVARSFDRRILKVEVSTGLERGDRGLRRLERLICSLDRDAFVDPAAEVPVLQDDLTRFLRTRLPYDTELALELEWM